jgi:putative (di)nucleoside polyphosphate hydrolase
MTNRIAPRNINERLTIGSPRNCFLPLMAALSPELRKRWGDRWRGQQQKWFVMRFLGSDAEIDIATEHPEFSAWKWVAIDRLPELVVSFKRQLYLGVLAELRVSGTVKHAGRPDASGE